MKKTTALFSLLILLLFASKYADAQKIISFTGTRFVSVDIGSCTTHTIDSTIGNVPHPSGSSTYDHIHHRYFFIHQVGFLNTGTLSGYDLDSSKEISITTPFTNLIEIEYCDSNNTIYGLSNDSLVWINLSTLATGSSSMPFSFSGVMAGGSTFDQVHGVYYDLFDGKLKGVNIHTMDSVVYNKAIGAEWEYSISDGKFYGISGIVHHHSLSYVSYDPSIDSSTVLIDSVPTATDGYYAGGCTYEQSTNTFIFGNSDGVIAIKSSGTFVCSANHFAIVMPEVIDSTPATGHKMILKGEIDTSTGAALKNQWVYLLVYNSSDSTISSIDSVKTDTSGHYSFETADSLVFLFASPDSVSYPNELGTYYDSSLTIQSAKQIHLTSSANVANFNTLGGTNHSGGGFIGGKITMCNCKKAGKGQPVANIRVLLVNDKGKVVAATKTNANGDFGFANLNWGYYKIWLDYPNIDNNKAPEVSVTNFDTGRDRRFDYYSLFPTSLQLQTQTSIANISPLTSNLTIYPNPFTSAANIEFTLVKESNINLAVYDIMGHEIQKLENEKLPAGKYKYELNAGNDLLSPGIYIVKLAANNQTMQLIMVKQ